MTTYSASNAKCLVFSFKDGLLSKLAHDLKIQVTRFSIEVDEEAKEVRGTFDTQSLEVVCAQMDGRDNQGCLSRGDMKKIHGNINKDVLKSRRFPEAIFESSSVQKEAEHYRVIGNLTLHGRTERLSVVVREEEDNWVCEVPIQQPDFGIKPFSAALGALKVKPEVRVRVTLPRPKQRIAS